MTLDIVVFIRKITLLGLDLCYTLHRFCQDGHTYNEEPSSIFTDSCSAHVFSLLALAHSPPSVRPLCPDHKSINLDRSAFSSQIPLQVSKLSRLFVLDLSHNDDPSTGNRLRLKDPGLEKLVQNLSHLAYLNLDSVDMSSPVFLPEFQPNSRLREIFVYITIFFGKLPPSVRRLAHLENLDLSANGFSGSIPSSLGNLTKLTGLKLSYNGFSGDIPFSLANLTQLEALGLSYVNLDRSQQLHSLLFNLNKLMMLLLTGMNLATEIPSFISNLTRLECLDLLENQLIGQIPPWLMNQTRLEYVSLDENHLRGPIPQEIFQQVNLQGLGFSYSGDLHGNFDPFLKLQFLTLLALDGQFPEDTASNKSHPKLKFIFLSSCNLAEFPQFLRSQDELEIVSMAHNQIHGLIPQWFLNISTESLHILRLSHNNLTAFEHSVKMLPWNYLKILQLNGNQLQGSLPMPPTSMQIYQVSNNQLHSSANICHASSLKYLDISNNDLGGHIPDCISELARSLVMLNMQGNNFHVMINVSQNQLEGGIPRSLVYCSMLVVLDIGQNCVNDTFPSWLGSLPNFQVLVLRHNNFHGRIMDR
ncbi:LOW QUALITY PROTEIN: hypothetical protein Cgig2_021499 [Carnegiea gigantea]|uniref:Uncharacterized protein n=1 Tax=Carnegiea gigantea TaxID=171969 RepID=A0A9Q1QHB4_9CARY|nr:LOW QUALITY PROTEIN: hypothetical protein Cgig2_021499 [Carnegiea gigantea]